METDLKPDHPGIKIPPPLFYVLGLGLGAWLDHIVPLFHYPERPARIVAFICAVLWLAFAGNAMGLFRRANTSILPIRPANALVVTGIFRLTRNPMYVSLVFLYLAVALWFGLAWPLLLLPFVIAVLQFYVIKREERYLERRFGQSYRDYQARVRRWL